jgi:hypothetical protein
MTSFFTAVPFFLRIVGKTLPGSHGLIFKG